MVETIQSNTALLPAALNKISKSDPRQLASVKWVSDRVWNPDFQYQNQPTTFIYAPSRFDGTLDYSVDQFVGQIIETRPNPHPHNLVIVLGYNVGGQNPDPEKINRFFSKLNTTLQNPKIVHNTQHLQVILSGYRWDGLKYPFGLMRQALITKINEERAKLTHPSITLVAMDGDVKPTKGVWTQLAQAQRGDYFGAPGFTIESKSNGTADITTDGLALDFCVQTALKQLSRPNETLTYMTGNAAEAMLNEPTPVYPVFDNENNHLFRFFRSKEMSQYPTN